MPWHGGIMASSIGRRPSRRKMAGQPGCCVLLIAAPALTCRGEKGYMRFRRSGPWRPGLYWEGIYSASRPTL